LTSGHYSARRSTRNKMPLMNKTRTYLVKTGILLSLTARVRVGGSIRRLLLPAMRPFLPGVAVLVLASGLGGCVTPVGADKASPVRVYDQTHRDALSGSQPSLGTLSVLHRYDQIERFAKTPDAALQLIQQKALESRERGLLFALSELNSLAAERIRRSVKPWEPRDARDYYLASAVYAWFFLFGDATDPLPTGFDPRFRTACDLYNNGLAWALTERRSTNALAVLAGGTRHLPMGQLTVDFERHGFPWSLAEFDYFVVADQFLVRGLSTRNRQSGLGAPLVGVSKADSSTRLARCLPATVLLRVNGGLADLVQGRGRASLELYSAFDTSTVQVGDRSVPLETDTTVSLAYALNQPLLWRLGMLQFLSYKEVVPSDIYMSQPYEPGKIPVVFVHGTFSSPVWWAEMFNTLFADPGLRQRYQFWQFVYNSGNPTSFSAVKMRESLTAKLKTLDPEGKDPALQQMVVIGHSQGGLLTKLTATDTGDKLLDAVLKTNRLEDLDLKADQKALIRRYMCFEALPFVKRVVFISTPHRGSYLASSLTRRLARALVSLPSRLVDSPRGLAGLTEKLDIPKDLQGTPTSLDSMSPNNPVQQALAEIPLAPGVKGHSIIAVLGDGDYLQGKDGLVAYSSAHVTYVESEFIVRGPHSCQGMPPTIEEVRRILHEHLASLPAGVTQPSAK
jgi:pimeloyl-ACP methyl ester carboxylesterase